MRFIVSCSRLGSQGRRRPRQGNKPPELNVVGSIPIARSSKPRAERTWLRRQPAFQKRFYRRERVGFRPNASLTRGLSFPYVTMRPTTRRRLKSTVMTS